MENLQNWFLALDTNLQVYWTAAVISGVIFLVQLILTLVGIDSDIDTDVDFDGDTTDFGGLSLFSIRSIVNFFLGFGWTGVGLWGHVENVYLLYVLSVIAGLLLAVVCLFVMRKLKRLEKNGAYRLQDAIGKTCSVYLRVPANRSGKGKIQISLGGSIHEINAVTDGEQISTGNTVEVLSVVDSSTVLVK